MILNCCHLLSGLPSDANLETQHISRVFKTCILFSLNVKVNQHLPKAYTLVEDDMWNYLLLKSQKNKGLGFARLSFQIYWTRFFGSYNGPFNRSCPVLWNEYYFVQLYSLDSCFHARSISQLFVHKYPFYKNHEAQNLKN